MTVYFLTMDRKWADLGERGVGEEMEEVRGKGNHN